MNEYQNLESRIMLSVYFHDPNGFLQPLCLVKIIICFSDISTALYSLISCLQPHRTLHWNVLPQRLTNSGH